MRVIRRDIKHPWGWESFSVGWRTEAKTGRSWRYHGIVRHRCLRLGPVDVVWMSLHTWWPVPREGEE